MQKSESIIELTKAIIKSTLEYEPVVKRGKASFKTRNNDLVEYDFVMLVDVVNMARPIFAKNDIWITQEPVIGDGKIELTTSLFHTSGEFISYEPFMLPIISSNSNLIQSVGTSLTFARRYNLLCVLGLVGEDDFDANEIPDVNPERTADIIKKPHAKNKKEEPKPEVTAEPEPETKPEPETQPEFVDDELPGTKPKEEKPPVADMKAQRKVYIDEIAEILEDSFFEKEDKDIIKHNIKESATLESLKSLKERCLYTGEIAKILTNPVFKEADKKMMRQNIKEATSLDLMETLKDQCLQVEKIREAKLEKGE